jgi:hypothetical protein
MRDGRCRIERKFFAAFFQKSSFAPDFLCRAGLFGGLLGGGFGGCLLGLEFGGAGFDEGDDVIDHGVAFDGVIGFAGGVNHVAAVAAAGDAEIGH